MSGLFFAVGVLFLGFSFLSGFLEIMMLVYSLFPWSAQLVCSQGMINGIGGWDTGLSWRKEGWKRMSL